MKSLRVAERVPELTYDAEPRPLARGPQRRCEEKRARAPTRTRACEARGEQPYKKPAREASRKQQQVREPRGYLRVSNHREREPVAGEVEEDRAREPAREK